MATQLVRFSLGLWICFVVMTIAAPAADQPQYEHGDISIPKATVDESKLDQLSVPLGS